MSEKAELVYAVVRTIPEGKVLAYGEVGRLTERPLSPREVGSIMRQSFGIEIPWWRVVAADGSMATARLDPRLAAEQRTKLNKDGVAWKGDRVAKSSFWREG